MASPLSGILPAFAGRWANADHLAPVGERYERLSWAWRSTFRLLARSIDLDQHAQWLAIQRELRITFTDDEDTSHWRLDNLFLDGRGVPTLVEVKRSSDPRSRREVVAQLLDYAASFHADWSHGKLQDLWRSRDDEEHGSSGATFDDFLASSAFESETAFWDAVDTNVSAGKLRLLIVCDQLCRKHCRPAVLHCRRAR